MFGNSGIPRFFHLRKSFLDGKISSSRGGNLGLTKNIGEWNDGELYKVANDIDKYFEKNF